VTKGYLGDPEKTEQRFVQHPTIGKRLYKTGDLGRYIDGALIEILGREDAQVKINGYRVELGEIEACLLTEKGADHIVIDAPLHPKTGQRQIVAYVVPTPDQENEASSAFEQRLQDTAQKMLPTYMVPSYIIILPSMPLTPNGKIDRKALPSPWGDADSESSELAEPENDLEHQLLALWKSQLQHQDIGVTQGFFDVGGDSLHAVGLLSAIRESFDVPDSAEQAIIEGLFMNACIRTFSGILEKLTESKRMGDL
jgi:acyl carrier protein